MTRRNNKKKDEELEKQEKELIKEENNENKNENKNKKEDEMIKKEEETLKKESQISENESKNITKQNEEKKNNEMVLFGNNAPKTQTVENKESKESLNYNQVVEAVTTNENKDLNTVIEISNTTGYGISHKGISIGNVSAISYTPRFTNGFITMLKFFQSKDTKRVIFYLQSPVLIGSFSDFKTFTVARFNLVNDVLQYYSGLRKDFTKQLMPNNLKYQIETTSDASMGFKFFSLLDTNTGFTLKDRELLIQEIIEYDGWEIEQNKSEQKKLYPVLALPFEISYQNILHNYELSFLTEGMDKLRLWIDSVIPQEYLKLKNISAELIKNRAVTFIDIPTSDYLRPMLIRDLYVRDKYINGLNGYFWERFMVGKEDILRTASDILNDMNLQGNRINNNQKLPSLIVSQNPLEVLRSWLACYSCKFCRIEIPITPKYFDIFDPLLIMSILVIKWLFPRWMITDLGVNLMDNYLYYQLFGQLNKSYFTGYVFEDLHEYRIGTVNVFDKVFIKAKNNYQLGVAGLLCDYVQGGDLSWADAGKSKIHSVPNDLAEFYGPGRDTWYITPFVSEDGDNIDEIITTSKLTDFISLMSAMSTDTAIWKKGFIGNKEASAIIGVATSMSKKLIDMKMFLFKLSIAARMQIMSPLCTPPSDVSSTAREYYEVDDKVLDPIYLIYGSAAAIPLTIIPEKMRFIGPEKIVDFYFWSFDVFNSLHELFEIWVRVSKVFVQPFWGKKDRIEITFSQKRRYSCFLDDVIKQSWLKDTSLIPLFYTDRKNDPFNIIPKYGPLIDNTELFISAVEPSVYGYVEEFGYTSHLINPLSNENFDLIYCYKDEGDVEVSKEFDGYQSVIDLKLKGTLQREVDKSVSNGKIKFIIFKNIPVKFNYSFFTYISEIPEVMQQPFNLKVDNLTYGSITLYLREVDEFKENVDFEDEFLLKTPPKFVIPYKYLPFIDIKAVDVVTYLSKIEAYTDSFVLAKFSDLEFFKTNIYSNYYI